MSPGGTLCCHRHEAFWIDHLEPQLLNRAGFRKVISRPIPVVNEPNTGPISIARQTP